MFISNRKYNCKNGLVVLEKATVPRPKSSLKYLFNVRLAFVFYALSAIFGDGPFSYSEKESQSNDTLVHFVEFSNVHNCNRNSNATQSNLVYKNV